MKGDKPKLIVVTSSAPKTRCPAAPKHLAAEAAIEWRRAAPELHRQGRLSPGLASVLELYCVAQGTARECEAILQVEGRTMSTERGPTVHPAHKIQMAAFREARLLAAELRITRGATEIDAEKGGPDGWDSDLLA